jgi:acyl carrier protein
MLSETELSDRIKEWVMKNGQRQDNVQMNGETDLIASGALDSMGFIDLLMHVETITGRKIDLSDLDPSVFTSIQGLAHSVLAPAAK